MLFLLAVGLVAFVQPVSVTCGSSAVTQSQAVRGSEAMTAVLKASTEDDHAKDTHLCMADYKLEITRNSDKPHEADLLSSDNDWGREISIQLGGFSHDGKQVIGMFFRRRLSARQTSIRIQHRRRQHLLVRRPRLTRRGHDWLHAGELAGNAGEWRDCHRAAVWERLRALQPVVAEFS
jgi:hypothetical protein